MQQCRPDKAPSACRQKPLDVQARVGLRRLCCLPDQSLPPRAGADASPDSSRYLPQVGHGSYPVLSTCLRAVSTRAARSAAVATAPHPRKAPSRNSADSQTVRQPSMPAATRPPSTPAPMDDLPQPQPCAPARPRNLSSSVHRKDANRSAAAKSRVGRACSSCAGRRHKW